VPEKLLLHDNAWRHVCAHNWVHHKVWI
jgi:hypothetical protein